jgi:hypothetical protein
MESRLAFGMAPQYVDELQLRVDTELTEDRGEMVADSTWTEKHLSRDLGHPLSKHKSCHDFPLACSQLAQFTDRIRRKVLTRDWEKAGGPKFHPDAPQVLIELLGAPLSVR